MAEGINDFLNRLFLSGGICRRRPEVSEKGHSEDWLDRTIFVCPSFSVLHCIYWTGVSVPASSCLLC